MTERIIRVIIDPSGAVSGSRRVGTALGGVERKAGLLTRGLKTAAAAAAGLVAVLGVRQLIQTADAYAQIQNRLRIVTDSTEELTQDRKSVV